MKTKFAENSKNSRVCLKDLVGSGLSDVSYLTRVMALHLGCRVGDVDRVEDNVGVLHAKAGGIQEAAAVVSEEMLEAEGVLLVLAQRILVASLQI